jgi:hypothetical protein
MGNPPVDGDDDYPAAVTAFREAWARLLRAVHATRVPQLRFDRATETGKLLAEFVSEDADERGDAAYGIQEAESLTLTALGGRISMSKQRAGKLTGKARQRAGKDQQ